MSIDIPASEDIEQAKNPCVACIQRGEVREADHDPDENVPGALCDECHADRQVDKAHRLAQAMEAVDWRFVDEVGPAEAAQFAERLADSEVDL